MKRNTILGVISMIVLA